jgi:ankyrin repeat protein
LDNVLRCIRNLLENQADPNVRDKKKMTPLMHACEAQKTEAAE